MSDYQWHTLAFRRLGGHVKVTLDGRAVIEEELPLSLSTQTVHKAIIIDEIKVGQPIGW